MEIFIISAEELKKDETLYILVFFRGVYQSRQMKIKGRVGEQHQLGQKCFIGPSRIIYPVRGIGIVAPQRVAEWLAAQPELQDILDVRCNPSSRKLSGHTSTTLIRCTKSSAASKKIF